MLDSGLPFRPGPACDQRLTCCVASPPEPQKIHTGFAWITRRLNHTDAGQAFTMCAMPKFSLQPLPMPAWIEEMHVCWTGQMLGGGGGGGGGGLMV